MSPLAALSARLKAFVRRSHAADIHTGELGGRHKPALSNVDSFMPRKERSSSIAEASSSLANTERVTPPSPQLAKGEAPNVLPAMVGDELIAEVRNLVVEFVWGNKSQPRLLQILSHMISCQSAPINAYLMRSTVRSKLGDIQGAIDDCEKILQLSPNHEVALLQRTSFLRDSRITSFAQERSQGIMEGSRLARTLKESPYAILLEHAVKGLIKPMDSDLEELEGLVAAMPSYRCAKVVLASMYFARWLQTGDHFCGIRASELAVDVQRIWPDDKVAMSILWHRKGHLGQGCLTRSNPLGYTFSSRQPLYQNYEIRAHVFFNFPIEEQHPALKDLILSMDIPSDSV